jgi:hypothetical protein
VENLQTDVRELFRELRSLTEAVGGVKAIVETLLVAVTDAAKTSHDLSQACRDRHERVDSKIADLRLCYGKMSGKHEAYEGSRAMFWAKMAGVGALGGVFALAIHALIAGLK